MNLYNIKKYILFYIKLMLLATTSLLLCGYGYSGDLPELGKTTKTTEQNEIKEDSTVKQDNSQFELPSTKTFFPRIYSNYNINKYSGYLKDIKQFEPILTSIKQVIKSDRADKIQQFTAKVNILNLYVDNLKDKYGNSDEKNYESYKQLIILNKYLTETASYQREADKYRKTVRGSLINKLEDETYLRQKIDMSLNSLESVLEIIQNAN